MEKIFEGEEFTLAKEGDNALVGVGFAMARELVSGLGGNADSLGSAELEDGFHARIAAGFSLACDADVVDGASSCSQRFLDGVKAVQNIHLFSLRGATG